MPEAFDPYHIWLGIRPEEQPPNYYRLLAIALFEDNVEVIRDAAARQMAHVRTYDLGPHSVLSRKILNELGAAKACLLDPAAKAAYDAHLRQALGIVGGVAKSDADRAHVPSFSASQAVLRMIPAAYRGVGHGTKPFWQLGAAVAGGAAVVAAIFAAWMFTRETGAPSPRKENRRPAAARPDRPTGQPSSPEPIVRPLMAAEGKRSAARASEPPPHKPEGDEKRPPSERGDAQAAIPSKPSFPEEVEAAGLPEPGAGPKQKRAPPSSEEQKRLLAEIDEAYDVAQAKDRSARTSLARRLLEDGREAEADQAERFVLLRRASELACDAKAPALMLDAVEAMAAAGFAIEPFRLKAQLLKRLLEQDLPTDTAELSALGDACMTFAQAAAAAGAVEQATEVLSVAREALAEPRKRAQQALRSARAAATRARNVAEKAAREKKITEAENELEAIEAVLRAMADCAEGFQEIRREYEAAQAALERLNVTPDDPDASLAAGRWYCFFKGDWDHGLKLLAQGSDEPLKSLARQELASDALDAEQRIARGDAWWALAEREKSSGRAKAAMRLRAGHWYREALPALSGLAKAKAESRLAELSQPSAPAETSDRLRPPMAVMPFNERTAQLHQARWAKFLRVSVELTNSIGMKFVLIPPGEFEMGSTQESVDEELAQPGLEASYRDRLLGERPRHRVRITKPYWLGVTEVTQEQFLHVMGNNPSKFQGDPKRPVEQVSWDECAEFCRRLSQLPAEKANNRRYALPTEAQWEWACRAGNPGRWWFSALPTPLPVAVEERLLNQCAWYKANSGGRTRPVGRLRSNAWGLFDVYGNVGEWCEDWYDRDYYANALAEDPTGPPSGSGRVRRGGCWRDTPRDCRSAARDSRGPGAASGYLGFRACLRVVEKAAVD